MRSDAQLHKVLKSLEEEKENKKRDAIPFDDLIDLTSNDLLTPPPKSKAKTTNTM